MLEASLAILNAHVITLDAKRPVAEAIAIREEKIVAVGSNKEIREYLGKKTKLVDAKNRTIVPGFVDCHVHMTGFGYSLQNLELRDASSISDVQRRLAEYAKKNPEKKWLVGGRWDQSRFSDKRYPTRWDLDAAVEDKPVFLTRVCGHVGVVNTEALRLAGITKATVVEGGRVDLDEKSGEPNGILRENALDLIWKILPKHSQKELEEACALACAKAVEAGLTCVHWMVSSANEIRAIQNLYSKEKLPLRVYLGVSVELLKELAGLGLRTGFGDDLVKIGFVKILADGSLGGHTAALVAPYSDKPETTGMMLYTQKELNRLVLKAHKADLQLAIHAIGDRAVESVLNAYEKALKAHPRRNHRHRIEHCSVLNTKFVKRMKHLELIASVQPHFVFSDFWAPDRVGEVRVRWVYPFKTLTRDGLIVCSGSDCPVEPISPVLGIWAAATRRKQVEERLTAEEALKTYTLNAAYASFDEDKRGTIEVGKLADLTMLSDDLLSISASKIKQIAVDMTIVGGKIVFVKKQR
jgi:predicted amidohydrolase YtcJ